MYGKIFASLFTGSMRGKGDVQLTFAYMISNATEDGICDFTPRCIADATGKPVELIEACIAELEAPDEMSRTRTDEGRRLRRIDPERAWGWQIVNHAMYRSIGSREEMKEAERLRKREYRESKKKLCPGHVPDKGGTPAYASASSSDSGGRMQGGSSWTVEDCLTEATPIAMSPEMVRDFWAHYAAVGWIDAAGRRITNLAAALAKWKANQAEHGPGTHNYAGRKKGNESSVDRAEWDRVRDAVADAVWTAKEQLGDVKRVMQAARDKYRGASKLNGVDPITSGIEFALNNKRTERT